MTMRFGIVGLGAVGGYVAFRLAEAGFEVHALARSDYAAIKSKGLGLHSSGHSSSQKIQVYDDVQQMPVCDVVIVAVKTTSNASLKQLLPPLIDAKTRVVMLQNGIGMEDEIAQFVPADQIIGASCHLKVSKTAPGVITHYGFNKIELAQYHADVSVTGISSSVLELQAVFKKIGFDAAANEHLPTLRWKKLVGNIPISGLGVVLNASNWDLMKHPESFALVCAITKEVIAGANACGAHIDADAFYQYRLSVFQSFEAMPTAVSSMKEDFDHDRPLELEFMYARALKVAEKYDVSMPLTTMLYQQLSYLCDARIHD